MATRGFCGTCGTPLYYAGNGSSTWGLTAGSADVALAPDVVFYYGEHPEWLTSLDDLPKPDFSPTHCCGDDTND